MPSAAFWRAWSIWAISVAVTATALGYTAVHPLPPKLAAQNFGVTGLNNVVGVVFIAAFATVGALLAWKRPGNPIGWLLSATALVYAVGIFGTFLAHFHRTLTLANWLGWTFDRGRRAGAGCRRAAVPHRASALPRRWAAGAWAAGAGLAGGGAFGATRSPLPTICIQRQSIDAAPRGFIRPRPGTYLQHHGEWRPGADGRRGPGRRAVAGVPVPARPDPAERSTSLTWLVLRATPWSWWWPRSRGPGRRSGPGGGR